MYQLLCFILIKRESTSIINYYYYGGGERERREKKDNTAKKQKGKELEEGVRAESRQILLLFILLVDIGSGYGVIVGCVCFCEECQKDLLPLLLLVLVQFLLS